MAMVKVTFDYEPQEPDDEDPSGVSEDEYQELMERLMELGATNVSVTKTDG